MVPEQEPGDGTEHLLCPPCGHREYSAGIGSDVCRECGVSYRVVDRQHLGADRWFCSAEHRARFEASRTCYVCKVHDARPGSTLCQRCANMKAASIKRNMARVVAARWS